jgi:hypothetical protein
MKRLAISLVALVALLAMFATLSAAAQGVADDGAAPIINPAIDQDADLRVVGTALAATSIAFEGSAAPPR